LAYEAPAGARFLRCTSGLSPAVPDECMRLMTTRRVRHLPVLEGENVVGIVSMGDLVNWIIASHEQTIQHLQNYIAGTYPG
jgi:CBS-domain-containing membrane protein